VCYLHRSKGSRKVKAYASHFNIRFNDLIIANRLFKYKIRYDTSNDTFYIYKPTILDGMETRLPYYEYELEAMIQKLGETNRFINIRFINGVYTVSIYDRYVQVVITTGHTLEVTVQQAIVDTLLKDT
jgi:hypothetical protein